MKIIDPFDPLDKTVPAKGKRAKGTVKESNSFKTLT
jgi:hypothetical protein